LTVYLNTLGLTIFSLDWKKRLYLMITDWGDQLDVRLYLSKKLRSIERKRVLDVGCGQGFLLSQVPESNEKYGVDISEFALAQTKTKIPRALVKKASMYRMPFKSGFFDVVIMANVIPNVDFSCPGNAKKNQRKALGEAARVLKKGGMLFLTAPNAAWFGKYQPGSARKRLEYGELEVLLKPDFKGGIKGWNPFPPFPYFLPARVLRRIPGWFSFLSWICEKGFFNQKGKFFYTLALKK